MGKINGVFVTDVNIEATYDFMEDKIFLQSKERGKAIFVYLNIRILHYTRRKSDSARYTISVGEKYNELEIDYRYIPHLQRVIESQGEFNGDKLVKYINSNINEFKRYIVGNVNFNPNNDYDKKYFSADRSKAYSSHDEKWLDTVSDCRQEIKKILSGFNLNELDYSQLCKKVDQLEATSPYSS